MPHPDLPALRRHLQALNEDWAAAMRALSAEAMRLCDAFDGAGFDRAVAAYAADIASPAGDFVSRLQEAEEADDALDALLDPDAISAGEPDRAHHSTHFTRDGLRAA